MLINFKLNNFLSFDNEQTFTLISGNVKRKSEHLVNDNGVSLLKFSSFFGANASGKSNFIKAVNFAKSIILNGVNVNCKPLYCRIRDENKSKISSFDFEISIKGKFYTYGFDILLSENELKAEWLYELDNNHGKEILIFNRYVGQDINLNNEYFDNNEEIIQRLKIYYSDIKDQKDILFLNIMNKNKDTLYKEFSKNNVVIFKNVFRWFDKSLIVITPQSNVDNSIYFSSFENLQLVNEILSSFGTGINECCIEESSVDDLKSLIPANIYTSVLQNIEQYVLFANKLKNNNSLTLKINRELFLIKKINEKIKVKKVVFKHQNSEGTYLFSEESEGTQRLFDLLEILLNTGSEKVYFVDELDRCLHPCLTFNFVEKFLKLSSQKSQLIVTTHESRLLDFELLRRDEIWFTNRDKNGPTHIYSLEDFNERFDRKIDKAYLEGRYYAVPILTPIIKNKEKLNERVQE